MIDPSWLSKLEDVYIILGNSIVRYLVDNAQLEARDDFDRRALALYEDWARDLVRSRDAVLDVLVGEGFNPAQGTYPVEFSQYHFLSAGYLLEHVIDRTRKELDAIDELGIEISGWPQVSALVLTHVARHRLILGRARRLESERPTEPPKPVRIKGTSASRW